MWGRDVAEDPAPGRLQSRVGVNLRGHRLQPRADAEPAVADSSIRISSGRTVSGPLKTGRWSTYSPTAELTNGCKQLQEVKNEEGRNSAGALFQRPASDLRRLSVTSGDLEAAEHPTVIPMLTSANNIKYDLTVFIFFL